MTTGQAGYSGRPLAKKLGIKEGHKLLLVGAPANWYVPDLPDDVEIRRRRGALRGGDLKADVIIAFYGSAARLAENGPGLAQQLGTNSSLWVAWPRRAGGHESDVTDQLLRDVLLPVGVVDVKVAAIDQDWSGLKFVWRRENRGARARA
jgi:hypothetical protein